MGFRWRVIGVVLLSALVASAFSTILAHQAVRAMGQEPLIWRLALLNMAFWYGWAILALPLVVLTKRLRIDRRPRVAVPTHIAAVVGAALAHIGIQSLAQTASLFILMRSVTETRPEALAAFSWTDEWLARVPEALSLLIDWELVAGAGVVGVAHAFFYYREARTRQIREAQLETRLIEAQLRTLQQQLHPHFLFNTLHAISTLMHRDVDAAERMLAELGDLLRVMLDSGTRAEIRLDEELDFIGKYLRIEQARLGDCLTVEFDVDPALLGAAVPALVLQPLVENAIKHGISQLHTPGHVRIAAKRTGDSLIMTVTDNGPGPSERSLAALSGGIGVSNTRARLRHHCGDDFRFEFQKSDDGFTALVDIPFRRDPTAEPAADVA
jgi:signal transduction histidine kinase